jgi:general secretion pathway protein G
MTEDRGQKTECCCGHAAPFYRSARSADKDLSSVFCHLSSETGFTLIELVVVIVIVALLAGTLLNRIWFYQEQAEKTAMVEVANAIQTALVLQVGRLMARGTEAEISALTADNPMNWLAKQPANYSGEFYDPTPRSVAPGNWMFDLKMRELVYVVDRAEYFVAGKNGQKWIRYRVNLLHEPAPGATGKDSKGLAGALFEPVEPYRWLD